MKTLELENYGIVEMNEMEMTEAGGGFFGVIEALWHLFTPHIMEEVQLA